MSLPMRYAGATGEALRGADSMAVFCGGDKTFVFGEWRDWQRACEEACESLDPEKFKYSKRTENG